MSLQMNIFGPFELTLFRLNETQPYIFMHDFTYAP